MKREAYFAKLRDPRWQKMRLSIMERDKFTCQLCGDKDKTLHVHHRWYEKGEPWEIEEQALVTLCERCHELEGMYSTDHDLLIALTLQHFTFADIETLGRVLQSCPDTKSTSFRDRVMEEAERHYRTEMAQWL